MEIGPISAVRPVSMIKPAPEDEDLKRVLEVEHMGRSEDDEYTAENRKPSRGLEDEAEEEHLFADLDPRKDTGVPPAKVSLFA